MEDNKKLGKRRDEEIRPKALGFLCGIGSMLIGARAAGFEVLGNYEDRKFMIPESFTNNFKGAFFKSPEVLEERDEP